jgi:glycosyltransferase involved in cell wall biosynthesis
MLLNKQVREEIGKRAREHVVRNYDWAQSLQLMEAVYESCIENRQA